MRRLIHRIERQGSCFSLRPVNRKPPTQKDYPMFNPWLPLVFKTMQLGLEAQSVIALRAMRFAAGRDTRTNRSKSHDFR